MISTQRDFRMKRLALASILVTSAFFATRAMAAIKDYGLKDYVRVSKDLPHSENESWKLVCTMSYNCHFQPWIEVDAPADRVIRFNSSNPLVLYLTKTETCTTLAGVHSYEAQKWVSGEGAIYTIPAGVTVKAVKYRETGYDTTFAGSFECNDDDYNVLWKKAARTAYLCMRDHFYDCPDRERVGFWGDGTPELNQCFYLFDAASHQLCQELVLRKLEPKFYPGQHLEFLGAYGLWFYYLQTGDLESIRAVYEPTKTFLFETYQFGKRGTWFDWGKEVKDTAVIETCFYYNCLETLKKMALVTGHDADVAIIDQKLESIKSTFDSRYWKGSYYMSSQVTTPDDRANAMAVNAGLADRSKWQAIYDNVLTKKTYASCFFDRWVLEALCTMGRQDHALLRMYERYKTMIPCSFTTLWEHYDRWWASHIDAFDDASSLNHGWNPPALILSQTIAGVSPVAPGWSTYQVLPKEAFLTAIKVLVPSIKGNVTVDLRKTASQYALDLTSPAGTTAIVGIPRGSFSALHAIKVNNTTIWDGAYRGGVSGVAWHGEDADYVKFQVVPGPWRFLGLGTLPLTCPKPLPLPPENETRLDKESWTASASVPDGSFPFSGAKIPIDVSAANALDGDHWTGWRDMTNTRYPGQWFQVDMKQEQPFSKIVLDTTWALWDSPDQYSVSVSKDGADWGTPIATGSGQLGITTITFPLQTARHVRITQTGTNATYHWSIYEFDVYRQAPPAGSPKQAGKGPLKVFILAGQSNMEGQAVADLEGKDYNDGKGTLQYLMRDPAKAGPFQHLKDDQGQWRVREDVWVRYQPEAGPVKTGPLTLGFTPYGGKHHFGPELQFGQVMGDHFENQVLLIKTAWGGKSLYRDFRPPSSGGTVGPYYTKMLTEIREALAHLKSDFPSYDGGGYELAGFVWYQGWNDGCDPKGAVPQYEQNLVHFIGDVRHDLNAPRLPFVIGELTGPWVEAPGEWATLRKAQAAAATRPEFQGNALFVETHDFVRKPEDSPNPGHGHHEFGNAETYFLVGDALGQGMTTLLAPPQRGEKPERPKPVSHTLRHVEGWTVQVDDRLLAPPNEALGTRALRFLEYKLSDIKAVVAAEPLAKLQAVTIVLDLSHGRLRAMQYHPNAGWLERNGYSTDLAKCVHIPEAADLPTSRNITEQPWVVLHELAHAYHDQVLGFDEPRILKAYEDFKRSGRGERTLLYNGSRVRHYGLTDQKEFFAEMTESYFGLDDFFPFNRAELMTAESEIYELMHAIWGPVAGAKVKSGQEGGQTKPTPPNQEEAASVR